jgi:hypothetical protein
MNTPMPRGIGRYEVVERLTRGADGLFRARDPERGGEVAVLLVTGELTGDAASRRRVLHDAQTASGLRHPHLAAVLEAGEDANGRIYVVTEALRGSSLAARMASGPFSRVEALEIALQIAEAVQFLHEHGLVHGNISPDCVWVREDGTATLLLDFAATAPLAPAALTGAGDTVRSPAYLSPEQIQGRAADVRADEFALGILVYELVTARHPFACSVRLQADRDSLQADRDTPLAMAMRILHEEPFAIQDVVPDVPTSLARAVDALLQRRPEDRALDVEALRTARRVARQQGALLPAPAPVQVEPLAPAPAPPVPASGRSPEPTPLAADENVQFTVYRPRILEPGTWQTMLVFAHLAEPRRDRDDEPDPTAEVARQAAAVLGDISSYRQHTEDSAQAVPREGELTVVPFADGIEFNPPSRSFRWTEVVHREDFRLRAQAALGNRVVHGRVTVYLGSIVLAEIGMALRVQAAGTRLREVPASDSARPYRRVFASYSHRDRAIVEEFAEYARAIGDRYLRDVVDLRSGEQWEPRLEGLIREADVFQLFWSWNALDSAFVQQEWQYALSLGRDRFVRPVYWDQPLPARGGLPPPALRQLHFQQIRPAWRAAAAAPETPPANRPGDTGAYASIPAPAPLPPAPAPAPRWPPPPATAPAPMPSQLAPPESADPTVILPSPSPSDSSPAARPVPSPSPPRARIPPPSAARDTLDAADAPRASAPSRLASWRAVLGAVAAVAVVAIMLPLLWLSRQSGSTDLPSGAPPPTDVSPAPPPAGVALASEAERLWQRGDTAAALTILRRAADERPGDPAVQAQLSRIQADAEQRLTEARRATAGQAPRASVATADAHERRAAALAREGRQVDAIAQLVAAAEVVEQHAPAGPRGTRPRPDRQPRPVTPP